LHKNILMTKNNSLPLISVVLATYNGELFIGKQLDSILAQTYSNIEVIIVDDGSSDNTLAILQSYATQYASIHLYFNEENLGYVKNFEKGMLLAKGDFIAPSDQDDIWLPEKLTTLYTQIESHEIIYSNSELIDAQGKLLGKRMSDLRRQRGYDDCLMYSIGSWAPGHAMLIRKTLVVRAAPFPTVMSHDLWLGFVATCKGAIKYIDTPLVYYRQHAANVFGAIKVAETIKKKKSSKADELTEIRLRMNLMYEKCPNDHMPNKKVFYQLTQSYQSFSLNNNFRRMFIFFKYRDKILAYKNKSALGRWLFCFKMFFKIK
jgi:glycosyltransferase involved in cell wall biosynthesis